MATANAIAAVGQAILALIAAGVPRDEFGSSQFALSSQGFRPPMEEGISLYLYRITMAGEIRGIATSLGWKSRRKRRCRSISTIYFPPGPEKL